MKVKEVIDKCYELLSIEKTEENTDILLKCYNITENELATSYIPLITTDCTTLDGNKIEYKNLEKNAYRIIEVKDYHNEKLNYTLYHTYMEVKKRFEGVLYYIKYSYLPKEKTIKDNCEYSAGKARLLIFGTCAEYCLSQLNFEEAKCWHDKYIFSLKTTSRRDI